MKPEVICLMASSVDGRILPSTAVLDGGALWLRYGIANGATLPAQASHG